MTIKDVKRANREKLIDKKNVIGVGIGTKITDGVDTGKQCITVLVKKKQPIAALLKSDILPKRAGGYLIDVVEIGHVKALVGEENKKRHRPVKGGSSVGFTDPYFRMAGTLGMLVKRKNDAETYILSNKHVLINEEQFGYGDVIVQPGTLDGGSLNDRVAETIAASDIKFDGTANKADAAIARLTPIMNMSRASGSNFLVRFFEAIVQFFKNLFGKKDTNPIPDVPPSDDPEDTAHTYMIGIGNITATARYNVVANDIVNKSGRTTGVTTGKVLATDADIWVDYGAQGEALFEDQVVSDCYSQPGDSGSIILDDKMNVVGLLFAGSDTVTIFTPIKEVIETLNLDFKEV